MICLTSDHQTFCNLFKVRRHVIFTDAKSHKREIALGLQAGLMPLTIILPFPLSFTLDNDFYYDYYTYYYSSIPVSGYPIPKQRKWWFTYSEFLILILILILKQKSRFPDIQYQSNENGESPIQMLWYPDASKSGLKIRILKQNSRFPDIQIPKQRKWWFTYSDALISGCLKIRILKSGYWNKNPDFEAILWDLDLCVSKCVFLSGDQNIASICRTIDIRILKYIFPAVISRFWMSGYQVWLDFRTQVIGVLLSYDYY